MFNFWNRPKLLMAELTNHCNLRCQMCGIWAEKPKRNLAPEVLEAVLSQKAMGGLKVVALTGGEPFLLPDFIDYHRVARACRRRAHINISTNGYYTERTLEFLEAVQDRNLSVTISYDGVHSHDQIRGVAGSQERLLETARQVRRLFPWVPVSLKLTVMSANHAEITATARQCQEMGVGFRFKTLEKLTCHQSRYPSPVQGPDYNQHILHSIATQTRELLTMPVDTNREYARELLQLYEGRPVPCSCSVRTVFLGFDGQVFLCRKKGAVGNVLTSSFDDIWQSEAKRAREREMKICSGASETLGFRHH